MSTVKPRELLRFKQKTKRTFKRWNPYLLQAYKK